MSESIDATPLLVHQPKRLGFVTLGANVPSTRFRFFAFQKPLEARGHRCRMWTSHPSVYDYYPKLGWRPSCQIKRANRWLQSLDARWFRPDTIYLERGVFHDETTWMDARFRRLTGRLVLDVDDAIFLQFPEKIPKLIRMSDHVIVSNRPLYEYVSQFHDRITEIPTSVSLARYHCRDYPTIPPIKPTIGWMGTTSNLAFMRVCAGALKRLSRESSFTLLVVAPTDEPLRGIDLTGVDIRFERWAPETELGFLRSMDIGIMPLPNDQEWMKYKAATKLVQYMAIGIPAVASPIGVNADILAGDRVGIAASNEEEWFEGLARLLNNPDLRRDMGRQGRELVKGRFSVEANLGRLEQVLLGD
ncbi:MAG: glycosyltransferase family 4 protein [Planctomycetes bacterium]|nr:glycosyltransferase family 4 protein [Planctomycetota bacterium]